MMELTPRPTPVPAVELVPITRDNWLEAIALKVATDQNAFTPSVAVSLAKESIRPDGPEDEYRSYGIRADGAMVGFGQLCKDFRTPGTCWIGGFLIDRRFQRRGYGRAALRALIALARREPTTTGVGLTLEPHNAVARRLYESEGFAATGDVYAGELVFELRSGGAGS
ncbi:MAG: GNAT family N-acetyltransferase [Chloroflexi bacterium]|nr:GNAT family N-acetyltransferase [Chloroflexota bacterium]